MDKVFERSDSSEISTRQDTSSKRSSPENGKHERVAGTKIDTRKRPKLKESLQDESGKPADRIVGGNGQGRKSQLEYSSNRPKTRRSAGQDVLDSFNFFSEARETRSTSRKQVMTMLRFE
jgi:hypothetical protein